MKNGLMRVLGRGLTLILVMSALLTFGAAAGDIQIITEHGENITGDTLTMKVGDQLIVYYSLDDLVAEVIAAAGNKSYNFKASMSWSTPNMGVVSIAETETNEGYGYEYGYATILTANSAGATIVMAEAQITCTNGDGETTSLSGSASFLVDVIDDKVIEKEPEAETYPRNPFRDIDISKVENPFTDVPKNAWYYDYVLYLYAAGIYDGIDFGDGAIYSPYTLSATEVAPFVPLNLLANTNMPPVSLLTDGKKSFHPTSKENRANTVMNLYNGHAAIGGTAGSYTQNIFTDVPLSATYYQPVLWASANSVVDGYGNGKFGPSDGITREQFCAILLRYANYSGITLPSNNTPKSFTDSGSISGWAKDAVLACQKAGIIDGYPDGSFRPRDGITRAEIGKMIYQFYNAIP